MKLAINPSSRLFLSCPTTSLLKLQALHLPSRGSLRFPLSPRKTLPFVLRCRAMALSPSPSPSPSPPPVQVKDKIDLTEKEQLIFQRLLQVVSYFNLQTQLRVAGGWVRDKLLGKDCYDIDIALDNMLGREFCEKVNECLLSMGEETGGVAVIQSNPDQSKHLETARMRLFDIWVDFVNLRSEDYSENSRIPTMRFGTAEEDAYRRDLTINSLFYNINTGSVEDFTGRGLTDLKYGKIVTPLPPKETFLDDPLRVLRAIRFGARFGFILDELLKEAASCHDVRAAIADKISRERIGHEIDLMISGNQPVKAMTHILELQLFWVVFSLPPKFEPDMSEGCERLCLAYIDAAWNLLKLIGCSIFNDEERKRALYAALFLPLRETIYKDNKSKKIPVVDYIFRNSLKLKVSDAQAVINVHRGSKKFVSLIPYVVSDEDIQTANIYWKRDIIDAPGTSKLRIFAGFLLDDMKGLWRVALLVSTLLCPSGNGCIGDFSDEPFALDKQRELYKKVENAIITLGLDNVWEVKPLVNGKDIMSVLQLKSGTPLISEWQQKLRQWQLAHPSGTKDECLDWMKETNSKRVKME